MLAVDDLRNSMRERRRASPDAERRERRYSSRSPLRSRSPPTATRGGGKHAEPRLPGRPRDERPRDERPRKRRDGRDDRDRDRRDDRNRDRRDDRERESRDDRERERSAPERWKERGRWMQMYVGDGIGTHCVSAARSLALRVRARACAGPGTSAELIILALLGRRRPPCGEGERRPARAEERCPDRGGGQGPQHRELGPRVHLCAARDEVTRTPRLGMRVRRGACAGVGRGGRARVAQTLPANRVVVGPKTKVFNKTLKHDVSVLSTVACACARTCAHAAQTLPTLHTALTPVGKQDVVVVPEFFCAEDDWDMYYALVEEMRGLQRTGQRDSEWIPWAEGSHLISKNPKGCPTYEKVCARVAEYFAIKEGSQATRFNWYRDSSDWKPFHNDSAAYNPQRAKQQNITVGVSFGAERELAFLHGANGSRVYFPQCNGMLFAFGRDVNIKWKHGVNALPKALHDGKGRISIILWGLTHLPIEEPDSPPLICNTPGHPPANGAGGGGGGGACRDFANGHCRYGDRCRFSHDLPDRHQERR